MNTQIVNALREAGAELPSLKQRVWNFLKDHPNSCHRTVAAGINVDKAKVSATLQQLTRNNLVYVTEQPKKIFLRTGVVQVRQIKYYRARGEAYHTRLPSEAKPAAPLDLRKDPTSAVPEFDFRKFVKQLTPYQAREFYNALKEIFE